MSDSFPKASRKNAASVSCVGLKRGYCSLTTMGHTQLQTHLHPQGTKCDMVVTDTGSGQLSHSISVRSSHIPLVSKSQDIPNHIRQCLRNAIWLIVPT